MEVEECGTRLTDALFAKDHLLTHEKGESTLGPHFALLLRTDPR